MSDNDRLLQLFNQLSESGKNSSLDFMEYLVTRQPKNQSEDTLERNRRLNEMVLTLNSLTTEQLSDLIWVFRGMELALQTDQEKRDALTRKWIQNK